MIWSNFALTFMYSIKSIFSYVLMLPLFVLTAKITKAQCNNPISTFPYLEGFESGQGGWSASADNYWEWGTIAQNSKLIINSSGGGQKCWIVGGLSGSNYGSGNAYLQSPCFDLSGMANPEISLKVFWETERNFDGVRLLYSIDAGSSWSVVGSNLSNGNCDGTNWYNNASVRFLNNQPGWSGSIFGGASGNCQSGGGSAQWLTARHSLSFLNAPSQVIFRFEFGAGTICNDYDGFAVDDIIIREATAPVAAFSFNCSGNNTVSFSNIPSACQTSIQWNFGDPASGTQNQSTAENPSHIFSTPGQYLIRLTTTYPNNVTSIKDTVISVLAVSTQVLTHLLCNGDNNGSVQAIASGGNAGSYTYSWNTTPSQQTPAINGLSAGNYTVTVTAPAACPAAATVSLVQPSPIEIRTEITDATCGLANGSIRSFVTGGNLSYIYQWSNNQNTENALNLTTGAYELMVTDVNGCRATKSNIQVGDIQIPANPRLGADTTICPGQSLLLNPGNFRSYLWQDLSTTSTINVTVSGIYSVRVENNAGCFGQDTIQVNVDCSEIYFPAAFTPNGDGLNDAFGALGNVAGLVTYELQVFNRWGQRVFFTINPMQKWNGYYLGKPGNNETYIWTVLYKLSGRPTIRKTGSVSILR